MFDDLLVHRLLSFSSNTHDSGGNSRSGIRSSQNNTEFIRKIKLGLEFLGDHPTLPQEWLSILNFLLALRDLSSFLYQRRQFYLSKLIKQLETRCLGSPDALWRYHPKIDCGLTRDICGSIVEIVEIQGGTGGGEVGEFLGSSDFGFDLELEWKWGSVGKYEVHSGDEACWCWDVFYGCS